MWKRLCVCVCVCEQSYTTHSLSRGSGGQLEPAAVITASLMFPSCVKILLCDGGCGVLMDTYPELTPVGRTSTPADLLGDCFNRWRLPIRASGWSDLISYGNCNLEPRVHASALQECNSVFALWSWRRSDIHGPLSSIIRVVIQASFYSVPYDLLIPKASNLTLQKQFKSRGCWDKEVTIFRESRTWRSWIMLHDLLWIICVALSNKDVSYSVVKNAMWENGNSSFFPTVIGFYDLKPHKISEIRLLWSLWGI